MAILSTVGIAVALLFYGALCACCLRKPLAEGLRRFRALPCMVQVMMAVMVVVATVEAQKQQGSTNEPPLNAPGPLGAPPSLMMHLPMGGSGPTVSAEDIQRGYRLDFMTNDASHVHAMPANAQRLGNVHVHGAASSCGGLSTDGSGPLRMMLRAKYRQACKARWPCRATAASGGPQGMTTAG